MADTLDIVGREALEYFSLKNAARERALPKSRATIRYCANSIRAAHRQQFQAAAELLAQASALLGEMAVDLRDHQDIFYAGFVQDAQKEYAEASTFVTLVQNRPLPLASDLSIEWAPYLNGLGEAVGELRRYVLDQLRRAYLETDANEASASGESRDVHYGTEHRNKYYEQCELLLRDMDDIYALLTTIDFPDAITGGLRRTTDAARGILEKTRGDLTSAVGQAQLQRTMLALQQNLQKIDLHRK